MSHVVTCTVELNDMAALREAAREMGAQFVENQRTYAWYGRSVGDYPLPPGMTEDQLGKCDHAIRVPGVRYEIGVVRKANGKYTLAWDFYGSGGQHDGQKLLQKFGDGCKKLIQQYSVTKVTMLAKRKGYFIKRTTLPTGAIKLEMKGM